MARLRALDPPLRRDVRLLGRLLGEVLVEQEGQALFDLEEEVRRLAIQRRRGPVAGRRAAAAKLAEVLERLPVERAEPVLRAFSVYFQLVNLAEQHHRIRRAREHARSTESQPQRGSLEATLLTLKTAGVPAERVREAIRAMRVTLTLTAHPTQAVRRTLLEKLYRMAGFLEERDRCELTPRESADNLESLREEITSLWETDELRRERPTVGDEVKNILWYVEEVLAEQIALVPELMDWAFERAYGEPLGPAGTPVRVHSWVGGDMDGNPLVTPEVFADTLRAHRARGLRLLLRELEELGGRLSQSSRHAKPSEELEASLARDAAELPEAERRLGPRTIGEPWRRKLRFIEERLQRALSHVTAQRAGETAPMPAGAYRTPEALLSDLDLMARSLEEAKGAHAGLRQVRRMRERVCALGLSLAELEARVPAEDAVSAAASLNGGPPPTEGGARLLAVLTKLREAQAESGEPACRTLILSMASTADDVLAAFRCVKHAGLWDEKRGCATVDVVPLFEQLGALDAGPDVLRTLFANAEYRRHLDARGVQEVMVGYSDSGKEVGLLAASAALQRAQIALTEAARAAGVPLRLFHGRGESVARGGGPAQEAILALPPGAVAGGYKATEQGEALDHKYARPELARRTLELVLGGVLLHTLDAQPRPPPEHERTFRAVFDTLADTGRREYRALVWEDPHFLELFTAATPVEEIASLPIGSRPSKRKAGGLETLRAIPWVFAWTQNRAILPGWYGVGSALEAYAKEEGGAAMLKRMYREWPFFRTVIDNVTMVLAKTDMAIAGRYAKLAPAFTQALWRRIQQEHLRTRKQVKRLTGELRLLDNNPSLQRSISLRNPYVDPMSFLQVELLKRKRQGQPECDRPLLLTLNGIAAGMRNTG
ncbi:phosphoenolpyruvate carboxylase [Pyxidicoccus parkwayensis]|uniref:Phosphoenolpyruvate carboxylase n=1 Tax=Pyxidicoccus parkwayensis TaxID=2813578 RepID=A0ABX7P3Q9_9BACT|nr:phosphoenolpyruvate carboxylase [Pyxidicoccus parkwaysis]QSQ25120.1 phosphoenolpyruvate carboxylase [Pyxidicoccus parkwaysis]